MIIFRNLSTEEFGVYLEDMKRSYAKDLVRSWQIPDDQAAMYADHQVDNLLPEGLDTPHHQVQAIVAGRERVGIVWYACQAGSIGYIYDLFISEDFRRQGLGTQVMDKVREKVIHGGCSALALHVFAHNQQAQRFYHANGLEPVGIQMYQKLLES